MNFRVHFEIHVLTCIALHGQASAYMTELSYPYVPSRSLKPLQQKRELSTSELEICELSGLFHKAVKTHPFKLAFW